MGVISLGRIFDEQNYKETKLMYLLRDGEIDEVDILVTVVNTDNQHDTTGFSTLINPDGTLHLPTSFRYYGPIGTGIKNAVLTVLYKQIKHHIVALDIEKNDYNEAYRLRIPLGQLNMYS